MNFDIVSFLLIVIGIMGCMLIYMWQHRSLGSNNISDYINEAQEELSKMMKSEEFLKDIDNTINKKFIQTLLNVGSENILEAGNAWMKVMEMVDSYYPFYKTGYLSTLLLDDTRYTSLVKDVPEDISDVFEEVKGQLDKESVDLELLADKTLVILRWFKDYRFNLIGPKDKSSTE